VEQSYRNYPDPLRTTLCYSHRTSLRHDLGRGIARELSTASPEAQGLRGSQEFDTTQYSMTSHAYNGRVFVSCATADSAWVEAFLYQRWG
jgi:hypothetical protein